MLVSGILRLSAIVSGDLFRRHKVVEELDCFKWRLIRAVGPFSAVFVAGSLSSRSRLVGPLRERRKEKVGVGRAHPRAIIAAVELDDRDLRLIVPALPPVDHAHRRGFIRRNHCVGACLLQEPRVELCCHLLAWLSISFGLRWSSRDIAILLAKDTVIR